MVNYYKLFPEFKKQYQTNKKLSQKDIPLDTFVNEMMHFYGIGDRLMAIDRWCTNFRSAGFISIEKIKNRTNDIIENKDDNWIVNFIEE